MSEGRLEQGKAYVKGLHDKGMSDQQIRDLMVEAGWKLEAVNQVLKESAPEPGEPGKWVLEGIDDEE